jgi:hypothetical protein
MLEVVEISFVMDKGATQPINCRLSDGSVAVVKYPNNICGTQTLINEWIGSSIAKVIGVTVPEFGICDLPIEMIYSNLDVDFLDEDNCGECFYSTYLSKAVPKVSWGIAKNHEVERLILLDHILNNCDRHPGNLFIDNNTGIVYAIDYSHLFTNTSRPNLTPDFFKAEMDIQRCLSKDVLKNNYPVYDDICFRAGFSKKILYEESTRIKSLIKEENVEEILSLIPLKWQQSVPYYNGNSLKSYIMFRVDHLDLICEMIAEEIGG